jgi:hypothetical protein
MRIPSIGEKRSNSKQTTLSELDKVGRCRVGLHTVWDADRDGDVVVESALRGVGGNQHLKVHLEE